MRLEVLFGVVAAPVLAFEVVAALGLFEERAEDAEQRDNEGDAEEGDAGHTPERGVAGGAGLVRDVGEGQADRQERERSECGGEDVEVASHAGRYRIREQSGGANPGLRSETWGTHYRIGPDTLEGSKKRSTSVMSSVRA